MNEKDSPETVNIGREEAEKLMEQAGITPPTPEQLEKLRAEEREAADNFKRAEARRVAKLNRLPVRDPARPVEDPTLILTREQVLEMMRKRDEEQGGGQ